MGNSYVSDFTGVAQAYLTPKRLENRQSDMPLLNFSSENAVSFLCFIYFLTRSTKQTSVGKSVPGVQILK